jgi:hypothetical protein
MNYKIWGMVLISSVCTLNLTAMDATEQEASCCSYAGLSEWFYESYFSDNFKIVSDNQFYRSRTLTAERLKHYITENPGIRTVVNLRNRQENAKWWQDEERVCREQGIVLINIQTDSDKHIKREVFEQLIHIFREEPKPILIHDKGGVARTGEIAALWLITQWNLEEINGIIANMIQVRESLLETFGARTDMALEQLSLWHLHIDWLNPKRAFIRNAGSVFTEMVTDRFMQKISNADPLLQAEFLAAFLDRVYALEDKSPEDKKND